MRVKKSKVEVVETPPQQYTYEFMISEKADPQVIESGSCVGTDLESVWARLRKSFSEYDILDVTLKGPFKEKNNSDKKANIIVDEREPSAPESTANEKLTKEQELTKEEDNGLIVLPLDYFQPIELEA